MDTNSLIREARARFQHQEIKLVLQEKYTAQLTLTSQGGLWNITPELLVFLRTAPDTTAVLLDGYKKPVRVNVPELLAQCEQTYAEVMDQWHQEYETLRTRR